MASSILGFMPVVSILLAALLSCVIAPAIFVLHIIAMIKTVRSERLTLPVINGYTDQWKWNWGLQGRLISSTGSQHRFVPNRLASSVQSGDHRTTQTIRHPIMGYLVTC